MSEYTATITHVKKEEEEPLYERTIPHQQYPPPSAPGFTQGQGQGQGQGQTYTYMYNNQNVPLYPNVVHTDQYPISYDTVGGIPQVQQAPQIVVIHHEEPCFNIYWVFLILGLVGFSLFFLCGMIGLASPKQNEKLAGKANLAAFAVYLSILIFYILVITNY